MNVSELIQELQKHPGDMPVKVLVNATDNKAPVFDFTEENILCTSEGAYVDHTAPEDEWDHEDGKVTQSGKPYLLINPILV